MMIIMLKMSLSACPVTVYHKTFFLIFQIVILNLVHTFSFLSFLASLTKSFSSTPTGEPTKATILILWFFPRRCLSAKWAILIPGIRFRSPLGWTPVSLAKIFPESVVSVVRTSRPPRVSKPTLDSGLDRSFDWVINPTAS